MKSVLPILGVLLLVLAFLSLFISRQLGERFQSGLLLVLGLLGLGIYISDIAVYGSSDADWIGVGVSVGAACLGGFLFRRENREPAADRAVDWRTAVWRRQNRRAAFGIDLVVVALIAAGAWLFGGGTIGVLAVVAVVLLNFGASRGLRRLRRGRPD